MRLAKSQQSTSWRRRRFAQPGHPPSAPSSTVENAYPASKAELVREAVEECDSREARPILPLSSDARPPTPPASACARSRSEGPRRHAENSRWRRGADRRVPTCESAPADLTEDAMRASAVRGGESRSSRWICPVATLIACSDGPHGSSPASASSSNVQRPKSGRESTHRGNRSLGLKAQADPVLKRPADDQIGRVAEQRETLPSCAPRRPTHPSNPTPVCSSRPSQSQTQTRLGHLAQHDASDRQAKPP